VINVVFCIRKDWKERPGGDVIQLVETKNAIESAYKCSINIISDPDEILNIHPDIVHIFNMQTFEESKLFLTKAKQIGAFCVLSTVYWDMHDAFFVNAMQKMHIYPSGKYFELLKRVFHLTCKVSVSIINKPYSLTNKYRKDMANFLGEFDAWLPNSEEEYEIIQREFRLKKEKYIALNAVSNNVFCFNYNENRNGILCVGRFEPIKNQLSVCKALLNTELNLILIGAAHAHNKDYLKKIQKVNAVNNNIHIITKNIEQYELNSYYNKCRVHVLASFRESPGLSSLEALATGANIVVSSSQFCPIDTYFKEIIGKHVFLCNPYSISSIRKAIEDAYNAPLMRKSINRFSWDLTAKQTYLAYQEIINNRD